MADELDALLTRVDDEALRRNLAAQITKLRQKRQFGLVFEEHIPELVALPQHSIRRGSKVVRRGEETHGEPRVVLKVANGIATLGGGEGDQKAPTDELVTVAEFGEPIYPGIKRLGSIDRGGDKPAHVVIKAENYHALEALQFTHAGKVDCIYIDPPYNTGARDWKYNNDYVDKDDAYRHSKWLAFMQRRLLLAKTLLNPAAYAIVVTSDEKEYLRLGLILQQIFPDSTSQMVSSVVNPPGTDRQNEFSRTNEYVFVLTGGDLVISPMLPESKEAEPIRWKGLRRTDLASRRGTSKGGANQFYPIYVDIESRRIVDVGDPLEHSVDRSCAPDRDGCATVFPVRNDGTEMNWGITSEPLMGRYRTGFVRVGKHDPQKPQPFAINYLTTGSISDIQDGKAVVSGHSETGAVIAHYPEGKSRMPRTQWEYRSHDAHQHGTEILKDLLGDTRFPFPKSLYAIEDVLRILTSLTPNAVILDFFVGSGTTPHAVARLNRQDGGHRRSISVTNNEVSAAEAKHLSSDGFRAGDPEWEALGIFEHVTRPRLEAAITGLTPGGEPVKGDYKFTDEFPMAEGFEENIEFVELEYLDAEVVELDHAFEAIAPLLWMRAGSLGPVLTEAHEKTGRRKPYVMSDHYAVLFNPDRWRSFVEKLAESVQHVFVVTDSASEFVNVVAELPEQVEIVRLYENYLSTFAINTGSTAR